MGLGMLGIFIVIGMIVGVTYLLNYMFAPKNKKEKKAGVFLVFLWLFVRVNGTMKKKEGAAMEEKARAVKQYLAQAGCPCFVLEKTDSTNSRAREMLLAGAPHGTAVLALSQTKGRGRLDRAFSSEEGGLYLSFIYKKEMPDSAAALTFTVALACAEALESVVDVSVGLKWVNDLYICGKKVGGVPFAGVGCAPGAACALCGGAFCFAPCAGRAAGVAHRCLRKAHGAFRKDGDRVRRKGSIYRHRAQP